MKSSPRSKDASRPALKLGDDLDVFSIARAWETLNQAAHTHEGDLVVDLSGVQDLDLCGIQVLAVVDKAFKARGAKFVLMNVKPEWRERLEFLGLAFTFAEPSE